MVNGEEVTAPLVRGLVVKDALVILDVVRGLVVSGEVVMSAALLSPVVIN